MNSPFATDLLAWYRVHKRSLPWRDRQDDAYAVWVSEIMLQQTTVAAVIPFYERWMASFPTVRSLAEADLQDVLQHWSGLGYYARARNLKRAAEIVAAEYGGGLPGSVEGLLTLPGVGRYTAGAIASIAMNLPAPILDGNVIRILTRIHAISGDIDATATKAALWRLAEDSIPAGDARDFNQAMMELGATVCSPAAPQCGRCPVNAYCAAFAEGNPTNYPVRAKKTAWVSVTDCAAAIERDGKLLIVKRPEHGLWGGLWELPRATLQEGETPEDCAARAVAEWVGMPVKVCAGFGTVKHTVMNRRMTLLGFHALAASDAEAALVRAVEFAWVTPEEALKYPLSSPQKGLVGLNAADSTGQGRLGL